MLMRWDPLRETALLQREINRLFEGAPGREHGFGETRFPPMDVSETENAVKIRAFLPGMSKDDVKISFHQNVLSISGEKRASELPEGANMIRNERSAGRFQRTLRLLKPVEEGRIEAQLRDGVLTLTLTLREEVKPKQIEVSVR